MNVFEVSHFFSRPVEVSEVPQPLETLRAEECGACHEEFLKEWQTSIHSQAWTDPYFQADWLFDGEQQICKNCHTPLERQQEYLVEGFNDKAMLDPILSPNPNYDKGLQHEGVTCAACHFRDGAIVGPYGSESAPHPVRKLENSNEICLRCHVVPETRWDVFVRFPMCGTVAELLEDEPGIDEAPARIGASGEIAIPTVSALGCVECHMPAVERPIVPGGPIRSARKHLWRGGHDPEMVKQALSISFEEAKSSTEGERSFELTLENTGAGHYVPTGIPDRHLTVSLRTIDIDGAAIEESTHKLNRSFIFRPFIIQIGDTRLKPDQSEAFALDIDHSANPKAVAVEAVVQYHFLEEKRRRRIDYRNEKPISYEVFRKRIGLTNQ